MRGPRKDDPSERTPRVSKFAWRLERSWQALALSGENQHAVVAVSGGADSTALLLALHELVAAKRLDLTITAAHMDHGLRGDASRADAGWLGELAARLNIPLILGQADTAAEATRNQDNLEQAARRLRYDFLAGAAAVADAALVLTAHTMNDQAETVLLRLMRGSGLDGLGGIEPIRSLSRDSKVLLVRPLIADFTRDQVEEYCASAGIDPRRDAMNSDPAFARVAVRHELLPQLKRFNPNIVETLVRTAELLRQDAAALEPAASAVWANATVDHDGRPALPVRALLDAPIGLRRHVIRLWLETQRGDLRRIEATHLETIESLLHGPRGGRIAELPGGAKVERRRGMLIFFAE